MPSDESPWSLLYVENDSDRMRIDAFLSAQGAFETRSAAAKHVERGEVLLNGFVPSKSSLVRSGDVVSYIEEVEEEPVPIIGENIPLDIRYEDEYLLVLSKQPGLVCHPADGHYSNTLVNALIWHCGKDHLCDVQGEKDRYGIVHRLDMDTSGLMLAAKTNDVGLALMQDIQTKDVERHYQALVHDWIALDTGYIDAPIGRNPSNRLKMCVSDAPSARQAITTFKVLERLSDDATGSGYSLVDCKLFTGRTHQIRVHMAYIKHPIVGDPLYGWDKRENLGLDRQFLHSYRLSFTHPITGERLEFDDHLPEDLSNVINSLR